MDAIVSATSSPHRVLKEKYLSGITKKRHSRLYVYDLAMPRDVEPEARDIPGIFLQDLDDLNPVFGRHNTGLDNHVRNAELLILHHIFEIVERIKEDSHAYSYQGRDAAKQACSKAG